MSPPDRSQPWPRSTADPAAQPSAELQVCPQCDSDLVQPVQWSPVDMVHWQVELRCPDCGWQWEGTQTQDALDRFDAALDAATERLLESLEQLERDNMENEVERLSEALDRDLLLPEDF